MIENAILAHHAGNCLFVDREGAAEAAAFIRPAQGRDLDSLQQVQQPTGLAKRRSNQLAGTAQAQLPQPVTALVEAYPVREPPLDAADLDHVRQEFA